MENLKYPIHDYLLANGYCATPRMKTIFKEEIRYTKKLPDHSIIIEYMKGGDSEAYRVSKKNGKGWIGFFHTIRPEQFFSKIDFDLQGCPISSYYRLGRGLDKQTALLPLLGGLLYPSQSIFF